MPSITVTMSLLLYLWPQLPPVTFSMDCKLILPVVRGTQECLGSSKVINEIKSWQLWWLTACLVSHVQTGVPLKCRFAWTNMNQKYPAGAGKRKSTLNSSSKGYKLTYSQVLCRQNIRSQQKYMRHAKYIQPLFFIWSKFFIGTSSTSKSNLHITHREVYLVLQDCA